jgi:putative ubiquitin-RnfH superfamily antitoxin RatB of RatAB toxin-antitoxin module
MFINFQATQSTNPLEEFELYLGTLRTKLYWPKEMKQGYTEAEISTMYGIDLEADGYDSITKKLQAKFEGAFDDTGRTKLEITIALKDAQALKFQTEIGDTVRDSLFAATVKGMKDSFNMEQAMGICEKIKDPVLREETRIDFINNKKHWWSW